MRMCMFTIMLVMLLVAVACGGPDSESPSLASPSSPSLAQQPTLASYSLKALGQGAPSFLEVRKMYRFNMGSLSRSINPSTGQIEHISFFVLEIDDSGWVKVTGGTGGQNPEFLTGGQTQGWLNLANVIEIVPFN